MLGVQPQPDGSGAAAPAAPVTAGGAGDDPLSAALGLFKRHIAGKIIIPYLVVIFLLALFATYTAVNLIAESLEEKFKDELVLAGRSANEAMVTLEDRQLAVLRQMVRTVGMDAAVAGRDTAALQTLLAPVAANQRIPYLDVFAADGRQLLALRSPDLGSDAATHLDATAAQWEPIRRVLRGDTDELGDKHAGIVRAPWGHLFVTAAPIKSGTSTAGVVAIALPIEDVTARLSQEAGSKAVSLYSPSGQLVITTVSGSFDALAESLAIPGEQGAGIISGEHGRFRRATVADLPYVEALGILAVRRQPAMIMGIGNLTAIIGDKSAVGRNAMIVLFSAVVVAVLLIGVMLARLITRPVRALVGGTERIRRDELDFELPVVTEDETGILTTAFNEMTGGLRERKKSRVAIEKYMSPKVYRLIQAGELKMGGESREITVFKTDIRGFTSISETMEPAQLIAFLNEYFTAMVAPVTKYDGEVDKYMGDAILAKFGATEWYPDHARRAVLAMIEMIEACEQFAEQLRDAGGPVLKMGIGANTGEAVVGNLGSEERMEYTIISDAVNTAQRIEELCKEFGWDLLISGETYEQAQDAIEVGKPWAVQLRGQNRDTLIYPVLGRKGEVPDHRWQAYQALVRNGLATTPSAGEQSAAGDR